MPAEHESGLLCGQADHAGETGRVVVHCLDPAVPALNASGETDEIHEPSAQGCVVWVVDDGTQVVTGRAAEASTVGLLEAGGKVLERESIT